MVATLPGVGNARHSASRGIEILRYENAKTRKHPHLTQYAFTTTRVLAALRRHQRQRADSVRTGKAGFLLVARDFGPPLRPGGLALTVAWD
jgi:hypothetical protein